MSGGHWNEVAKLWSHVGPPYKASPEDLEYYWEAVSQWKGSAPPDVLILGVTQELYHLPWPTDATVAALDNTQEMIDNVWPGPKSDAVCGDWTQIPLPNASKDIALCDGGLTVLDYPAGIEKTASELARVLRPGGLCVFRLYTPPQIKESPSQVFEDLQAGNIPSLSHFKLRIATAMQIDPIDGVVLADIWTGLTERWPDLDALAQQIGWPPDHLKAINTYRGCKDVYRFMTIDQIAKLFQQAGFEAKGTWTPTLSNCPMVAFQTCS